MKRPYLTLCTIILFSNSLFAQKNVIKINLFSPILKTFNIAYEGVISRKLGLQFRGHIGGGDEGEMIYGFIPELRYYPSDEKDAPEGFYAAPFLRYIGAGDGSGFFGGGFIIGIQPVFGKITLDAFIGINYLTDGSSGADILDISSGFLPRAGVAVGIAF